MDEGAKALLTTLENGMNNTTKAILTALAQDLDEKLRDFTWAVRLASGGKPHHQSCWIGGLWRGMACSVSGDPCWCGVTKPERKEQP